MEMELEPRVKPLSFKIKAMSRESLSQKAANVLDSDLRTHWSTGTNTKEWIVLELDEPCLLSHIKIYNKSVHEWEITVGLRFKPEAFVKVRPRCEAPKREMIYPMNYTPCRYVLLLGVTVTGLEPEFQPIANYLLPQIISRKQDAHDLHLQLLQDVAKHLLVFLPQLEADLTNFPDVAETSIRFLAMLAGPFYPILRLSNERRASTTALLSYDLDASKSNPSSTLTVSSNFEKEVQKELEQVESGVRSSRREFSSNPSRERYRDRDNARSGQDICLKSSGRGHDDGGASVTAAAASGSSPGRTVVLAASARTFSGQPPIILQSRDRTDERATSYEDSVDGNRDSADTGSIGESELGLAFDGLPGAFGSAGRHGSRGSKSRQVGERRERDGRRESKWERKH